MKDNSMHLNEDQILVSMIDESDLSEDGKGHLDTCQICQEKKTALISELENLGKTVKDFAPMPHHKPVLLLPESQYFNLRLPVFASGIAVFLIIACLVGFTLFTDSSKQITGQFTTEAEVELYLLDDILEESVLPEYYLDIAVTSNSYFDDEFLEFITPMEEQSNSV